jgi:hypothetical protein
MRVDSLSGCTEKDRIGGNHFERGHPSPEAKWDGPEFYFAVISEKKLSRKQVGKIYKEVYKDE